jgi:hypothetical protein
MTATGYTLSRPTDPVDGWRAGVLPLAYPFDWSRVERFDYPLDKHGIPLVEMGGSLGRVYNPITIAQYGLHQMQIFAQSRSTVALEKSLRCGRWLVENAQPRCGGLAWIYDYGLEFYGPQAPWVSAMAQGEAISLLLRCAKAASGSDWTEVARQAFELFRVETERGGVRSTFPGDGVVFEEYPGTDVPSHVLNGHIFALFGVFELAITVKSDEAQKLFTEAVESLQANLHRYDTGFWNLYDLHPTRRLASRDYVAIHVQQLRILSQLTGVRFFDQTARLWAGYLHSPRCRLRWMIGKLVEKVRLRFYAPKWSAEPSAETGS